MTEIRTSCFRSYRPSMGQAVVIALTTPKWMPQAAEWPKVRRLTPKWSYLNASAEEFLREYLAQLDSYGVASIRARLELTARQTGASTLVLLCHEADGSPDSCHRGMFREWAARHGWEVTEADGGKPTMRGEFRTHDDEGNQLIVADKRWTYAWTGDEPLAEGDVILVPFGKQRKQMTVTALGTEYAGTVRLIVGRQEEL